VKVIASKSSTFVCPFVQRAVTFYAEKHQPGGGEEPSPPFWNPVSCSAQPCPAWTTESCPLFPQGGITFVAEGPADAALKGWTPAPVMQWQFHLTTAHERGAHGPRS
jgi:hypothetical protein